MPQVLDSATGHFREIGCDPVTGEMRAVFVFDKPPTWPLGLAWAPLVRLQPTVLDPLPRMSAATPEQRG